MRVIKGLRKTFLFISAVIFLGLNLPLLHANNEHSSFIVGGQYLNDFGTAFPLLYISHDSANTWHAQIPHDNTLPVGFVSNGTFYASYCTEEASCVSVGSYFDGQTQHPMLAVSEDTNGHWTYRIDKTLSTLPANYAREGVFFKLTCASLNCAAIGEYIAQDNKLYSMLVVSNDGGKTWHYKVDALNTPPGFYDNGDFWDVHCSTELCAAVGEFQERSMKNRPLFITSADGGRTWHYQATENTDLPASYQKAGVFRQVFCTAKRCVTVGTYNYAGSKSTFMLGVSNGEPNNFEYKIEHGENFPTGSFDYTHVWEINAFDDTFVVVGEYQDISFNQYPVLIVSTDDAETWHYLVDKVAETLPENFDDDGALFGVSCKANGTCAAVGYYKGRDGIQHPILIVSNDYAKTWEYKIDQLPPSFASHGTLSYISCGLKQCAAVGTYYSNTHPAGTTPIVLNSEDDGNTWHYQISKELQNLPHQHQTTSMLNVHCSDIVDVCKAAGKYTDTHGRSYPMLTTHAGGEDWRFIIDGANQLPEDYSANGYLIVGETGK